MLFQNDNFHEPSLTASSSQQSSNSAVSSVRLSSGRFLALSMLLLIVQSWINLVAQVQTAFSLFLLAIIGWLWSKQCNATDQDPKRTDPRAKYEMRKSQNETQREKPSGDFWHEQANFRLLDTTKMLQPNSTLTIGLRDSLVVESALLRRANSALNLLRTINGQCERHPAAVISNCDGDHSSGHHSSFDLTDEPNSATIVSTDPTVSSDSNGIMESDNNWRRRTESQSQSSYQPKGISPNGSASSANSAPPISSDCISDHHSTGYQSSLASEVLNSPVRLIPAEPEDDELEPCHVEEINILSEQPTALDVLMERLTSDEPHYSMPAQNRVGQRKEDDQ